jgi:hypothetical protein
MPFVALLLIAQLICIVHVVRSRRETYWIWVILMAPGLGAAVYAVTQILPELSGTRTARAAMANVARALDPEKERRRIARELEIADTLDNRRKLAKESLALNDFTNATELYQSCLKGFYEHDPDLMLGLAQAQFGAGDHGAARKTLESLIETNPDYKSTTGHLLYARTLEASGEIDRASSEYEILKLSFPGEEARYRYAMMMKNNGKQTPARDLLQLMIDRSKLAPRYYQKEQRVWIELARGELRKA